MTSSGMAAIATTLLTCSSAAGGSWPPVRCSGTPATYWPVTCPARCRLTMVAPFNSSHFSLSPEELAAARIDPGMLRFSCGLEDASTLVADIERALAETA